MITRLVLLLSAWVIAVPACADRLLLQVEDFEGPWRRQANIGGFLGQGFCTSNAKGRIATTVMRGKSNLHYMVWDSIHAVDYLLTRSDVDPRRIGLTGNSGGGLNTMYTMPVESRLAAGATFCCLCSFEAWIGDGGNHCASDAISLGRPMLAQQTWDLICAARYLATRKDIDSRRIAVYGRAWTGILAATAAALEESISAVVTDGVFASYLHTIAAPLPPPRWVYATNLLRAADVPDLLALCSPRPVLWMNPTGDDGQRLPEERLRALLDRVDAAATVVPCLADAPEELVAGFIQGRRPPGSK